MIGLGIQRPSDKTFSARRDFSHTFYEYKINAIQSTPEKTDTLREKYLIFSRDPLLWDAINADIDFSTKIATSYAGARLQPLIRTAILSRYQAINHLLRYDTKSFQFQLRLASQATLTYTLLAYVIGVHDLTDVPLPYMNEILADHTLDLSLQNAAVLYRLKKDLGPLLNLEDDEFNDLIETLRRKPTPRNTPTPISTLIRNQLDSRLQALTCSIDLGKHNIALHGITHLPSITDALDILQSRLHSFITTRTEIREQLNRGLDHIQKITQNNTIPSIIRSYERLL